MKKLYIIFVTLISVVLFACTNNEDSLTGDTGYLSIGLRTVTTTINVDGTRAIPVDYDARRIAVEIINASGDIVNRTDDYTDWKDQVFQLRAGKYTVVAHSVNWDGKDAGRDVPYYYGKTEVTVKVAKKVDANIVCTQANVKVSVKFDASVVKAFSSAVVTIKSSVAGVESQNFVMSYAESLVPAYFPVGSLTATLTVINKSGDEHTLTKEITDVQARDHYILNYSTQWANDGYFDFTADDGETIHTYNFSVPTKPSTTLVLNTMNAWSNFCYVTGTIPSSAKAIDNSRVKFQYKVSETTTWETVDASLRNETYNTTILGLQPSTFYTCRMVYYEGSDMVCSSEKSFTTEDATPLPNGNLDNWCTGKYNGKDCTYPSTSAEYGAGTMFWDTSNPGSSLMSKMVTTQETSDVHTPGGSAARLGSQYIVIKFAAASMYAGSFGELKGTSGAAINFGRPWTSRPSQLKGWFKYSGGAINRYNGAPAGVQITQNSTPDLWSAYIVLADEGYTFDNTNIDGTAWNYETDPRVIAYGALADDKCVNASEWTQFTIDLDYHDMTRKPKTIIIVFSSSKYGDYFTGCDKSVLLLDDLELVYGEPVN